VCQESLLPQNPVRRTKKIILVRIQIFQSSNFSLQLRLLQAKPWILNFWLDSDNGDFLLVGEGHHLVPIKHECFAGSDA
jgi:hypothetical protein